MMASFVVRKSFKEKYLSEKEKLSIYNSSPNVTLSFKCQGIGWRNQFNEIWHFHLSVKELAGEIN